MKRTEDGLRDLWDNIKYTNIRIIGSQKKKTKRKGMRKFLKRLQLKISPTWEKKQSVKRPIQDKPKEKHAKTHNNQTTKD